MKPTKMGSRELRCSHCQKRFQVKPMLLSIRCRFCKLKLQIKTNEELSQDHASSHREGSFGRHLEKKWSGNSSTNTASPSYDCKPNPVSSTEAHQNKRALLCGVSYSKWKFRLKGTINDVNSMRSLLVHHFKFPNDSIRILTEEETDPSLIPTKENMQKALKWLVEDCQSGDSLVFYFSGHGLRQPDFNQDELDGFDETLCPVDFKTAGMILDNDINTTIVKALTEGVTLHAIIDACHSGTILDLEHVYNKKDDKWVDNKPPSGADKKTSGGLAISFSACADDQLAADTTAFSKEMNGAMTFIFIQAIKTMPQISYGRLLDYMHDQIEAANKAGCLNARILSKLFRHRILQEPQLSSSEEFDIYSKIFRL